MSQEYQFVYNWQQMQFYLSKNIMPVSAGLGSKKHVYLKFEKTEELVNAFSQWCILSKQAKGRV